MKHELWKKYGKILRVSIHAVENKLIKKKLLKGKRKLAYKVSRKCVNNIITNKTFTNEQANNV
ncbi:MAG: hypothetical protein ACREHG_02830 [Candidatus Saccharimonadales bacterium]